MKKKFLLLVLSTLICSCNFTSTSEDKLSENKQSENESVSLEKESEVLSNNDTSSVEETTQSEQVSSEEITSEQISSTEETSSEQPSSVEEISSEPEVVESKAKNITNYLGSDNDIYRINITTEQQAFPTNKVDYVPGNLNITEQDGTTTIFKDAQMGIRLRGNSTLDAKKKAFRVKFEKKQSLFGLTKAKSWVLLANYFDKSNARNYLAYLTANKLSNLNFQPSSIFVDVYFNNEYYGLYLLTEQMEAKEGRVDITDSVSEDGVDSFFLEADARASDEYPNQNGVCYLESFGYRFALKYPDADDYLDALTDIEANEDPEVVAETTEFKSQYRKDISWLSEFLDNVATSMESLRNYENYIDVNSFIDYYLVEELFKNVDVGSTSQYYYIDQTNQKLTAGPVWDFDIGAGAIGDINGRNDTYNNYIRDDLFVSHRDYYIKTLLKDNNFKNKVKSRYQEIRDDLYTVMDEIDILRDNLDRAQARNLQRWPFSTERNAWIEVYALSDVFLNISSIESHYQFLENYLEQRFELLDQTYGK